LLDKNRADQLIFYLWRSYVNQEVFRAPQMFPREFDQKPRTTHCGYRPGGGPVLDRGNTFSSGNSVAHVRYLVDPAAIPGSGVGISLEPVPVFLPPPGGMSPADDQGNPITNFTGLGSNGTITVQSSTSVPEPASVTILAISGVIVQMGPGFLVGAASITSATETFGPGQRGGQDSSGYTHRLLRY
jgi:hypothetical protein